MPLTRFHDLMQIHERGKRRDEAAIQHLQRRRYVVLTAEDAAFIVREIQQTGPCDVGFAQIKSMLGEPVI